MSITKSRISISIPSEVKEALSSLAKRDQVSITTKAEHLLELGLAAEEDQFWDKIAARRDTNTASFQAHTKVFNT
jgi:DNA-binding transcriptional regulator/RsmH inhibitor MraZ